MEDGTTVKEAEHSPRVPIRSIIKRSDGGAGLAGQTVKVGGWVKNGREQGKGSFAFIELNDGSCGANLQLIIYSDVAELSKCTPAGTCLHVQGVLQLLPADKKRKQMVEVKVSKVIDIGTVDVDKYPLPPLKSKVSLEYLRDIVHLRPRTNVISAIARIRSELAFATHEFFREQGFRWVSTPIITTSDCEGAGEMFQVTTLMNRSPPSEQDINIAEEAVMEKEETLTMLISDKASKPEIIAAVGELNKAKESLLKLEERSKLKPGFLKKDGKVDYGQDFFARQAFLTVSGQLQLETYACAISSVYTFGPTFRAEDSHTSRHLAEFWMVEAEFAFSDLKDDMKFAETYVKFMCQWLLDKCLDDMEVMVERFDESAIRRLQMVASTDFIRLSYTDAIKDLEEAVSEGHKFANKVESGIDLASEHEKYLTETKYKSPVIVYNYPKEVKAFYMKVNPDKKTVAAMDVLVPKVGELIGGSQREENYEVLKQRILDMGLPLEPYEWYLDLRRYGTVKHSGFGLGFERMILFATGIDNIRDVIPFPRYPERADL